MKEVTWDMLVKVAYHALSKRGLSGDYEKRLKYEIDEINKQGANRNWLDIVNQNQKFDTNKNGLLLPWLLGRLCGDANVDPILNRSEPLTLSSHYKDIRSLTAQINKLPFDIIQDDDKPDIDIDCLPLARDEIKLYAARRYGVGKVASVGTWQTYLFKQAIGDAYTAIGLDKTETFADFVNVFGKEEASRIAKHGDKDDGKTKGSRGPGDKHLAICLTKSLNDEINDLRNGGVSNCKGRVSVDGGESRECGFLHADYICPSCGSIETETPTIGSILHDGDGSDADYRFLRNFYNLSDKHKKVIQFAVRLVGCVSHSSKHAGAIIISDRDLFGNVPLQYDHKTEQWSSGWTEGSNTQLSKFGYTKWDILGLRNLQYIYECCSMIQDNHGVFFGDSLSGLEDVDPEHSGRAGVYWIDGVKYEIPLHDPEALKLANEQRTDAVFQFDTDLAKRILSNGVKSFWDLLAYNALGHPGPMQSIPEYVLNRDSGSDWRAETPKDMIATLEETHGIIVFQEQLTSLWQIIAGFTGPEAQFARKAIAKKWREKLKAIEGKWLVGAERVLGKQEAERYWQKMVTFGRYAFNKSHAVAYCLWAYRCLWFKAHYPEEWWAAVAGHCIHEKLVRYMSAARNDGVRFGEVNINRLTIRPTAISGKNSPDGSKYVALGLINLKNVGESSASSFADDSPTILPENKAPVGGYTDIDHFVSIKGKNKTLLERLIKLGAFMKLHPNIKATWMWYIHKYCTGDIEVDGKMMKVTALKQKHREMLLERDGWNNQTIKAEMDRQISEYRSLYPKKVKIPDKILKWTPKPVESRDNIMSLYDTDYSLQNILQFEYDFLGYYWHSPCDLYHTNGNATIEHAKAFGKLEGVIVDKFENTTKTNKRYMKLTITDGSKDCLVMLWDNNITDQDEKLLRVDNGISLLVDYDADRNSFSLQRNTKIKQLWTKKGWQNLQDGDFNSTVN